MAGAEKAEFFQDTPQVRKRQFQPGEARQFAERKIDDLFLRRRIAGDNDFRRFAAAEVEHHLGRELKAGQHEGGIDTTLEAVARIGVDTELAAGLCDIELVPKRRFHKNICGRLRATGCLAAHGGC